MYRWPIWLKIKANWNITNNKKMHRILQCLLLRDSFGLLIINRCFHWWNFCEPVSVNEEKKTTKHAVTQHKSTVTVFTQTAVGLLLCLPKKYCKYVIKNYFCIWIRLRKRMKLITMKIFAFKWHGTYTCFSSLKTASFIIIISDEVWKRRTAATTILFGNALKNRTFTSICKSIYRFQCD